MSDIQKYSILVAGGSGSRMGSAVPKQFLLLNDKPILVHTIERFLELTDNQIILVLPAAEIAYWTSEIITKKAGTSLIGDLNRIKVVEGGASRFQSVRNGLRAIPAEKGLVAIHDGVRPLVSLEIIKKSFEEALIHKAVVVSVLLKDSARVVDDNGGNKAIDRSRIRLMQTPQTFDLELIKAAFVTEEQSFFTDDASVVEHYGFPIKLIEGDYQNIKITTPEDLRIAEAFLT
jgi:2-C-methyl-D-erythritol 4-phosphate cytidylyltransferase